MTITLPDGRRIPLDVLSYIAGAGGTIVFTGAGGSTYTYTDPDASDVNAAHVIAQLDTAVRRGVTNLQLASATAVGLTGIAPAVFDVAADSITVTGHGFTVAAAGTLWVEDSGGGEDSNGYSMTCTVVDDRTLTAVPASAGDATLSADMLIYYVDADGNQSNVLPATNPSGTIIRGPASPGTLSFTGYTATPAGSDGVAANANLNGGVVNLKGTGFDRAQRGALVSQDGTITAPALVRGATDMRVTLPAMPGLDYVDFDYQYRDADGNRQILAAAIRITVS